MGLVASTAAPEGAGVRTLATQDATGIWTILRSVSHDPEEDITIFEHTSTADPDPVLSLVKNSANWLRKLRHPCLLKYEWEQGTTAQRRLGIVTEPVVPWASLDCRLTPHEALVLCHTLVRALTFLTEVALFITPAAMLVALTRLLHAHDPDSTRAHVLCTPLPTQCGLYHNNICLRSVFVHASTGQFKLGGFEFTAEQSQPPLESDLRELAARAPADCQCPDVWALNALLDVLPLTAPLPRALLALVRQLVQANTLQVRAHLCPPYNIANRRAVPLRPVGECNGTRNLALMMDLIPLVMGQSHPIAGCFSADLPAACAAHRSARGHLGGSKLHSHTSPWSCPPMVLQTLRIYSAPLSEGLLESNDVVSRTLLLEAYYLAAPAMSLKALERCLHLIQQGEDLIPTMGSDCALLFRSAMPSHPHKRTLWPGFVADDDSVMASSYMAMGAAIKRLGGDVLHAHRMPVVAAFNPPRPADEDSDAGRFQDGSSVRPPTKAVTASPGQSVYADDPVPMEDTPASPASGADSPTKTRTMGAISSGRPAKTKAERDAEREARRKAREERREAAKQKGSRSKLGAKKASGEDPTTSPVSGLESQKAPVDNSATMEPGWGSGNEEDVDADWGNLNEGDANDDWINQSEDVAGAGEPKTSGSPQLAGDWGDEDAAVDWGPLEEDEDVEEKEQESSDATTKSKEQESANMKVAAVVETNDWANEDDGWGAEDDDWGALEDEMSAKEHSSPVPQPDVSRHQSTSPGERMDDDRAGSGREGKAGKNQSAMASPVSGARTKIRDAQSSDRQTVPVRSSSITSKMDGNTSPPSSSPSSPPKKQSERPMKKGMKLAGRAKRQVLPSDDSQSSTQTRATSSEGQAPTVTPATKPPAAAEPVVPKVVSDDPFAELAPKLEPQPTSPAPALSAPATMRFAAADPSPEDDGGDGWGEADGDGWGDAGDEDLDLDL
ncbi:uncharacterized protein MONBRDRAFT_38604 [Monosiga brevicollis MX1]|uniref:Protein kinase domain-containing protein n=1 Tax=Monosiga brevicollis TaxID=81824 RepID=A9V920_MONBE|nr:uncharacterized protein MONBRDRAFT_38604 [Monosiga brevicollis MX1]EDQ86055.1 predicted protein [Monosiga brevicollis MX1]|eukprot:XP_001749249.1 hypothetical protein [Monosiga brevicollis MX1]